MIIIAVFKQSDVSAYSLFEKNIGKTADNNKPNGKVFQDLVWRNVSEELALVIIKEAMSNNKIIAVSIKFGYKEVKLKIIEE